VGVAHSYGSPQVARRAHAGAWARHRATSLSANHQALLFLWERAMPVKATLHEVQARFVGMAHSYRGS